MSVINTLAKKRPGLSPEGYNRPNKRLRERNMESRKLGDLTKDTWGEVAKHTSSTTLKALVRGFMTLITTNTFGQMRVNKSFYELFYPYFLSSHYRYPVINSSQDHLWRHFKDNQQQATLVQEVKVIVHQKPSEEQRNLMAEVVRSMTNLKRLTVSTTTEDVGFIRELGTLRLDSFHILFESGTHKWVVTPEMIE